MNGTVGDNRDISAASSSQERESHGSPVLKIHHKFAANHEKTMNTAQIQALSYHGAGPFLHEARKIIAETAVGEGRLMSAKMMMDTLRARGDTS
jgi:hypothetical protein